MSPVRTAARRKLNVGAWLDERDAINRRLIRRWLAAGRLDMVEAVYGAGWPLLLAPADRVEAVTR